MTYRQQAVSTASDPHYQGRLDGLMPASHWLASALRASPGTWDHDSPAAVAHTVWALTGAWNALGPALNFTRPGSAASASPTSRSNIATCARAAPRPNVTICAPVGTAPAPTPTACTTAILGEYEILIGLDARDPRGRTQLSGISWRKR